VGLSSPNSQWQNKSASLQFSIWGNSAHAHQVFKLRKRVVRVMSGVGSRSSRRRSFRKLNILPIACQCILPLMMFIVQCLWFDYGPGIMFR